MLRRRMISYTAIILTLMLVFTACSSSPSPTSPASTKPAASGSTTPVSTTTSGANVTLRYATYADDARMVEVNRMAGEFMLKYPNIKLELERAASADYYAKKMAETASKTLPDVWEIVPQPGQFWFQHDLLFNIKPMASKDSEVNLADFISNMILEFSKGDALYGLPYDVNGTMMYYNKDLFDQAGLKYPDNTWTMDNLYTQLKAGQATLAAKGIKVWGIASPIPTGWMGMGLFNAIGTPLVTDDGKMGANAQTVAGLEFWMKMATEGIIPKPDPANPQQVVTGGTTTFVNKQAFVNFGSTNLRPFDDAKMNYGVTATPKGPTGQRGAILGGGYTITGSTKYPNESYTLLKFWASPASIKSYVVVAGSGIPARKSLFNDLTGYKKDMAGYVTGEGYSWMPVVPGIGQIWTLKDTLLSLMWIGQKTPQQTVDDINKQGADIIKNAQLN